VRDIRMGWHAQLPGRGWALVNGVGPLGGDVMLFVASGLHDEDTVRVPATTTLMTRTPAEQIQWIEDRRQGARGGGPVSQVHFDQQLMAAVADAHAAADWPERGDDGHLYTGLGDES
jgi:hypothetical protein